MLRFTNTTRICHLEKLEQNFIFGNMPDLGITLLCEKTHVISAMK